MGTLQTIIVIEVPIAEQEQIADYLDKECTKIDKTINDKKEQLETIKEYKKSLIYEYVTGKKRVACWGELWNQTESKKDEIIKD